MIPIFSAASQASLKSATDLPKPIPLLVLREGINGGINEWSGPAKFVLYNDGTLITETSNEMSERGEPISYYQTHLDPPRSNELIQSLRIEAIMSASKKVYGRGEGLTWQLMHWDANSRHSITIIGSLAETSADVRYLIKQLENYPKQGIRYLDYNYTLSFSNPVPGGNNGIPWPKSLNFVKFNKDMLLGIRHSDVQYEYELDARHALYLLSILSEKGTHTVVVNGHAWSIELTPDPHLPSDFLWVRDVN